MVLRMQSEVAIETVADEPWPIVRPLVQSIVGDDLKMRSFVGFVKLVDFKLPFIWVRLSKVGIIFSKLVFIWLVRLFLYYF